MANNNLLNKFVKSKPKESLGNVPDLPIEQKFFDIESICNFLEYQNIQFLEEDAVYILKDLGVGSSRITLQMFDKFMYSSLWN